MLQSALQQEMDQHFSNTNMNLFSTGVLSVVCGFSSKLDVKKRGSGRKRL
jgi:hypothetical protein